MCNEFITNIHDDEQLEWVESAYITMVRLLIEQEERS